MRGWNILNADLEQNPTLSSSIGEQLIPSIALSLNLEQHKLPGLQR